MRTLLAFLTLLTLLATTGAARPPAGVPMVVINEIYYHAPDDQDALQFIELHNPGSTDVDLGGWKLTRGVQFDFPLRTNIPAAGYLVLCKDLATFKKKFRFDAAGQFTGTLSRGGATIELLDESSQKIDGVKYGTRFPWPLAPDGYGPSLERICPTSSGLNADNWAPSQLADGPPRPSGTPGKKNGAFAAVPPPQLAKVTATPAHLAPNEALTVEVQEAKDADLRTVEVRYRLASSGQEGPEQAVAATETSAGTYVAKIPGQKAGQIIRYRVHAEDAKGGQRYYPAENDLRPALSCYVHDQFQPSRIPFGLVTSVGKAELRAAQGEGGNGFGPPSPSPHPRGNSAYVHVDPKTGVPELFDFINVTPRSAGRKVRLHKDHPLNGMTTFNLIYEQQDRFVLAEPLAFETYRLAGNAACRTDFVRTWIDGRPLGYQLLIEQPNKAFLRHNKLNTDGNLYKCVWFGQGVVGQHEKHSRLQDGHGDVVALVEQLQATKGDEQWAVIKKNFDVEQVINYFAVNMLLSHWDGYFNNYYAYHDDRGTGKWTMYPWDQDKTWGFHDGLHGQQIFYDMPITFGMTGDVPPGFPRNQPPPQGFGFGAAWWRPAGHFSGPLLANPRFRSLFLARTKELLDKVYVEEVFQPLFTQTREKLEEEVKYRAQLRRQNPKQAVEQLQRDLGSLRRHLVKRRQFLLAQTEIKNAGAFDRSLLK